MLKLLVIGVVLGVVLGGMGLKFTALLLAMVGVSIVILTAGALTDIGIWATVQKLIVCIVFLQVGYIFGLGLSSFLKKKDEPKTKNQPAH